MNQLAAFALAVKASCMALGVSPLPLVEAKAPLPPSFAAMATTDGYRPLVYVDKGQLDAQDIDRLAWHECVHLKLGHHERALTSDQQHGPEFLALMARYGRRKR